jgi:N6-adenosine-specific RNA methylase IME4
MTAPRQQAMRANGGSEVSASQEVILRGEETLDTLASEAREVLSRMERDHWELGRICWQARQLCEDRKAAEEAGLDGSVNPNRRFGQWLSVNFTESSTRTLIDARRLWQVFGDRQEEVEHVPVSALYKLAAPKIEEDTREKILSSLGEKPTIKDVTSALKRERITEVASAAETSTPKGLYHVIVMDPPWRYDGGEMAHDDEGFRGVVDYPTLSVEEIATQHEPPAADDCVLWLWTTHRFMRHALDLISRWGFEEKAILTWVKNRMGIGRWLRSQSEFCVMAVKGSPVVNLTNETTVIEAPLREHSRKPDEFYDMVDNLCTGRKLDYFSRTPREGWDQFGNDAERF